MERANNLTVLKVAKKRLNGIKNMECQINSKPFQYFTKLNLASSFICVNNMIIKNLHVSIKGLSYMALYPKTG